MGMFFTLLYLLIGYLSPGVLFGSLAAYHIEIVVAAVAVIVSVPALLESNLLRQPQILAIAGMTFAVFCSLAASGWLGGAPSAVYDFLPNVFLYFLIVLHCKTRRHLQLIILTLLIACVFVTFQGWLALRANDANSLYIYAQGIGEGKQILRIRGLSFISDPNDFSQVLVSLLPAMFFFWKKGSGLRNAAFVYAPLVFLVFAMYLTHSRGAIMALLVVIIVAGRRKIGTIGALVAAGAMFAVSSAAGWSGGREISVEAGADRMEAWAIGLQLIRSHPIFGVGFLRFSDYYVITAHNTIVVCAAELGFVGLFFWVLFVFCSIRYGVMLAPVKVKKTSGTEYPDSLASHPEGSHTQATHTQGSNTQSQHPQIAFAQPSIPFAPPQPLLAGADAYRIVSPPTGMIDGRSDSAPREPGARSAISRLPLYLLGTAEAEDGPQQEAEIRRLAGLMVIILSGYLAAGWFLSRAYVMTIYIYGGMTQVLFQMAVNRGFAPPTMKLTRLLWMSAVISVGLLTLVHIILRLKSLMPG